MAEMIPGLNLKMPNVNWGQLGQNIMISIIVGVVVIGLIVWLVLKVRNKNTYRYPVTLIVRRANGTKTNFGLKGGLITKRSGVKDFKIIIPGTSKKKNLGYVPDFSFAEQDDRLTFIQEGDSTIWQQCKQELVTEKVLVDDQGNTIDIQKLLIEPIPTDIKTVTFNNLNAAKEVLDMKKLTAYGITILGFVIMVIAHLISLYIQTKIKCPATP